MIQLPAKQISLDSPFKQVWVIGDLLLQVSVVSGVTTQEGQMVGCTPEGAGNQRYIQVGLGNQWYTIFRYIEVIRGDTAWMYRQQSQVMKLLQGIFQTERNYCRKL